MEASSLTRRRFFNSASASFCSFSTYLFFPKKYKKLFKKNEISATANAFELPLPLH
ncbi:hypothetical protein EUTSA_v10023823mg, partial [Eutrema salsugineum]